MAVIDVKAMREQAAEMALQQVEELAEKEIKKEVKFNVQKRTSCVWFKFYAEQLGVSEEASYEEQEKALQGYLQVLCSRALPFYVHGIVHNKDTNKDDFWLPSVEKPHAHLLVLSYQKSFRSNRSHLVQYRISSILSNLRPLHFRPDTDDTLIIQSTQFPFLKTREHVRAIVYHTHETFEASETEGKHRYSRSECYTNIPEDLLDSYYEEYMTIMNRGKKDLTAIANYDKLQFMATARTLGEQGKDFAEWWFALPGQVRLLPGLKKQCVEEYDIGTDTFLSSPASVQNVRCAIFINGAPNMGKSYNSKQALATLGCKTLPIASGGTGKTDNLLPSHDAILVDDNAVKDILAMADNSFTKVYRRNNGNPLWCGKYFVITYNGTLREYLNAYYTHSITTDEQKEAVESRFYECTLTGSGLTVDSVSERGDIDTIRQRHTLFKAFYDAFEASLSTYNAPKAVTPMDLLAEMFPDVRTSEPETPPPPPKPLNRTKELLRQNPPPEEARPWYEDFEQLPF